MLWCKKYFRTVQSIFCDVRKEYPFRYLLNKIPQIPENIKNTTQYTQYCQLAKINTRKFWNVFFIKYNFINVICLQKIKHSNFLHILGQILFIKFSEIYNTLALKFEENRKIFSLIFSDILASAVLGLLFQAARTTQKSENNSHQPLIVGF